MSHVYATRLSLIRNAVEMVCESRALSHGHVPRETKQMLERQASELADRWATADAIDIASELLRWLRKDAPANSRVRRGRAA